MSATQAGAAAATGAASKLVLTHLPPQRDLELSVAEAQKAAPDVDVQLASDGLKLEIEG